MWIFLGLSILIQAPILYFVSSARSADDAKSSSQDAIKLSTNTRSDALIAVYILVTFHTLCAISMMCAFRSASKERSYAIEESKYEKEYEDEEYNSRYEEEISPNKPVVSFGDQQNPAGSFVVSLVKVKSKLMIMIRQRVKTRSTVSLTLPAYHLTR